MSDVLPTITSLELATRVTNRLFAAGILSADGVEALYDVLVDGLNGRPDIALFLANDIEQEEKRRQEHLELVMKQFEQYEQDALDGGEV